jgi:hypothetical protein
MSMERGVCMGSACMELHAPPPCKLAGTSNLLNLFVSSQWPDDRQAATRVQIHPHGGGEDI